MSVHLILPLVVGLVYAFASVFLKRSMEKGANAWTVLLVSSVFCGISHIPFFFWASAPAPEAVWFQPVFAGLTLFIGLVFTWLAVYAGDVSVANPVMGTKVIFVAFFTVVLTGRSVPPVLWGTSLLIVLALFLLRGPGGGPHGPFIKTVIFAALASVSFAVSDVLFQKWGAFWGVGLFPPLTVISMAVMSLLVLPLCFNNIRTLQGEAWKWLAGGSVLTGVQMAGLVIPLTLMKHENSALLVNIMFNSRGIWTVLIIWIGAGYLRTAESGRGVRTLFSRLLGAVLILAAIIIVLFKK